MPAALALWLALAATGCQMEVDLALDVERDGSGAVTVVVALDPDAAGRVTDLSGQLQVDDLREAGWTVDGPQRRADGATTITASKPFADVTEVERVVAEVSGADGPFQALRLERQTSFLSTTYALTGEVDLVSGIEGFGDDDLSRRLEGSGFGLATAQIEQLTGADIADTFAFVVRAEMPGSVVAAGATAVTDGEVRWEPTIGERTTLKATSRVLHGTRLLWLSVAATTALASVVALAWPALRRRGSPAG